MRETVSVRAAESSAKHQPRETLTRDAAGDGTWAFVLNLSHRALRVGSGDRLNPSSVTSDTKDSEVRH